MSATEENGQGFLDPQPQRRWGQVDVCRVYLPAFPTPERPAQSPASLGNSRLQMVNLALDGSVSPNRQGNMYLF